MGGAVVLNHEQRQWTNTSSGLAVKSGARGLSLIDSGPPRRRPSTLSLKGNLLLFLFILGQCISVYIYLFYPYFVLLIPACICYVDVYFLCQLSTATRAKRAF